MFKLRTGYLISGITTGLVLLFGFLATIPDGKLHLTFCDVGQGDATYVRFPDGRDMLVDGGPNNKVLECLGRHMPFWDRHINLVVMTHPQRDHLQGLIEVVNRFSVDYFVRSDVANNTEGYQKLIDAVAAKKVSVRFVSQGENVDVGATRLSVLWPSAEQVASLARGPLGDIAGTQGDALESRVLGVSSTPTNLNDASIVFWLRYGSFDAVLTGDADTRVESRYRGVKLALDRVEVLKVPHHGSRTAMTEAFLDWLKPQLAVISVGKNSYGHPAEETIRLLRQKDRKIVRTDEEGDIEIVSDGKRWSLAPQVKDR